MGLQAVLDVHEDMVTQGRNLGPWRTALGNQRGEMILGVRKVGVAELRGCACVWGKEGGNGVGFKQPQAVEL